MKILRARETARSYCFAVHLDAAKIDESGNPDLAYVVTYSWGKEPPGWTKAQHLAIVRQEIKLLAQAELRRRENDLGTALAEEGQRL